MKIINCLFVLLLCNYSLYGQANTEKWKMIELAFNGPAIGNPFLYVKLSGKFVNKNNPFEGTLMKNWDYSRLNPVFFKNIEA